MKGLIIKDLYTLIRQMKIFLLMIVLFSVMPGFSTSGFAVVYAAMLPMTALAYDERSKWDRLAAMMPYSAKDIVLSKYFLGYILVFAAALLSLAAKVAFSYMRHDPVTVEVLAEILLMLCIAVVFQAVNLPVMFKVGVEKGRLLFFAVIAVIVGGAMLLGDKLTAWIGSAEINPTAVALQVFLGTAVASAASMLISVNIYRSRQA